MRTYLESKDKNHNLYPWKLSVSYQYNFMRENWSKETMALLILFYEANLLIAALPVSLLFDRKLRKQTIFEFCSIMSILAINALLIAAFFSFIIITFIQIQTKFIRITSKVKMVCSFYVSSLS